MIRGGETVQSHWTFCPRKIKRLGFKVALNLRVPNSYEKSEKDGASTLGASSARGAAGAGLGDPSAREERVHVSVTAEGTSGAIALRPESLDFGHTIVDHPETRQIELVNKSGGVIRYRLETVWDDESGGFDADVSYDEPTGLVPARAGKFVEVRFVGRSRARVGFKIACHTVDTPTQAVGADASAPSVRSLLTFRGGRRKTLDASAAHASRLDDADADPPPVRRGDGPLGVPVVARARRRVHFPFPGEARAVEAALGERAQRHARENAVARGDQGAPRRRFRRVVRVVALDKRRSLRRRRRRPRRGRARRRAHVRVPGAGE
jgi:hypothetical protein